MTRDSPFSWSGRRCIIYASYNRPAGCPMLNGCICNAGRACDVEAGLPRPPSGCLASELEPHAGAEDASHAPIGIITVGLTLIEARTGVAGDPRRPFVGEILHHEKCADGFIGVLEHLVIQRQI